MPVVLCARPVQVQMTKGDVAIQRRPPETSGAGSKGIRQQMMQP